MKIPEQRMSDWGKLDVRLYYCYKGKVFFWIDGDQRLHTPRTGMLPGISREYILKQFDCLETDCSLEQLLEHCCAAFVTQATSGVSAVSRIGDTTLVADHQLTKEIRAWFRQMRGEKQL